MPAEMQTNLTRHAGASQAGAGSENTAGSNQQTFSVGYKKPPVQHRFQKGCSGNPGGRPRKHAAKPARDNAETVEDVLLEEGQRLVSIREGDKVVKLPTIRAIVRGLAVAAIKGDRRAQLAFRDLTETVETRKRENNNATFKGMIAYKERCQAEIARCKALGTKPPEFLPHPDDVKMDFWTGEIEFVGPLDERQKHLWDEVQAEKNTIIGKMVYLEDIGRRFPRHRKWAGQNFAYLEKVYWWMEYYVPDERVRRDPLYDPKKRGAPPPRPVFDPNAKPVDWDIKTPLPEHNTGGADDTKSKETDA